MGKWFMDKLLRYIYKWRLVLDRAQENIKYHGKRRRDGLQWIDCKRDWSAIIFMELEW